MLLALTGLAGCGGTDPASGRLQAAAASCVVGDGASHCRIGLTWSTTNATGPVLAANGRVIFAGPDGNTDVPIDLGTTTLTLEDQGIVLARADVRAECAVDTEGDPQGVCRPTVLRYTEKVYALFEDGYPRSLTRTTASRLVNATPYPRLGNCRFKPRAEANGRIEIYCNEPDGSGFPPVFKAYINPLTETIHAGDGLAPVEADYGLDDPWENIPGSDIAKVVERVSDGVFYVNLVQQELGRLWFLPNGASAARQVLDDRVISGVCAPRCGTTYFLRMVRAYAR